MSVTMICRQTQDISSVFRKHIDRENEALIELKKKNKKVAKNEGRKETDKMRSRREEAARQDEEILKQKKLQSRAAAEIQAKQMKEKKRMQLKEKLQDMKDSKVLRDLDQMHAEETRQQAFKQAEDRKLLRKERLEDISRAKLNREREARILIAEEQKAMLCQHKKEGKLLKRRADKAEMLKKLQEPRQMVLENLVVLKKEQATITARREEQSYANALAKREAEWEKQEKEKQVKEEALLQAMSAQRQARTQDKEQQAQEERKSNVKWLQALKDAERFSLKQEDLQVQKRREELMKCHNYNAAMAAEKRVRMQEQNREDRRAEVTNTEQTSAREKHLLKCIQRDLNKAAVHLSPIPSAKHLFVDKMATSGRSPFSVEGSSYQAQPLPKIRSAIPKLPPISKGNKSKYL